MTLILTLVSTPKTKAVFEAITALTHHNIPPQGLSWLESGSALDIRLSKRPTLSDLGRILDPIPVDWALQEQEGRGKMLMLSDMDSTIIEQECIDELADIAGVGDRIKIITEKAMKGEIPFDSALEERVLALKGLTPNQLEECYQNKISFSKGSHTLLATLKNLKIQTWLVSGGFTWFTERVAHALGFDHHAANHLGMDTQGHLSGYVTKPILGAAGKLNILTRESSALAIGDTAVMAIGDGANDLPMLEAAGLGIAYKAKPAVREKMSARIDHTDLTSVLYFLGLPKAAFAE